MTEKTVDKKRSIGEATKEIGVETHVIRFWESKFPQIKPTIGKGSRRYYFDKEIAVLNKIKSLLHEEGYSISGLQKLLKKRKKSDLKEQNIEFLLADEIVETEQKDFSLDDFIIPNDDLDQKNKNTLNQIITKIEINLNKLLN
jgi:DNA-binding transcriptional MerR regulator